MINSAVSQNIDDLLTKYLTAAILGIAKKQEALVSHLNLKEIYKTKVRQGLLVDEDGNELKPRILEGLGDVGQIPYPMFWATPSVPVSKLAHMTVKDIVETGKTGDILMCQGIAKGAMVIRQFTQSPFSHVLMVVKEKDLFDGKPVLIQATTSKGVDLIQGGPELTSGIMVNDIEDNFVRYNAEWGPQSDHAENPAIVCFRRLNMEARSENQEKEFSEKLIEFIRRTNGITYAENSGMLELYASGLAELDLEEKEGRTYYCASYIAQAMMDYGVITKEFESHQYGPRDFSMMYSCLPFLSETSSYGPEIVVDLDTSE